MAAEIDHLPHLDHQRDSRKSCPELSFDSEQLQIESQAISMSEILDHGSVSFGKYASEPLAWEKWSVFPHNRCQEELEKFKNPGLVAQKKAYFEEYYKKIRAMKALQEVEEEISEPYSCQYAQNSNTPVRNHGNSTASKDENNVHQTLISGNNTMSMKDRKSISLSTVKAKHSTKKVSISQTRSSASMKSSQKKSLVSNTVNHKSIQPKKNVPGLQAKGPVASLRNKTKLESSKTTQNAIKQSEKSDTSLRRKIIHKADKNLLPSKKSDPKAANNINRPVTKVCSTVTVPNPSLAGNKFVSSISSVRAWQMKPGTASDGLPGKLSTKPAVHAQSVELVSSSASKRVPQLKPSTNPQGLVDKLPAELPVNSQSYKSIAKNNTATGGLRNMVKRSANLSTITKSSQKSGLELGQRSLVGVKQKEGKEKLATELGRELKAPRKQRLSTASGRAPKAVSSAGSGKEKLSSRLGSDPKAASSTGPGKEKLSSRLERYPKAASSGGPGKEKLSSRLEKDPKAASSAGPRKEKLISRLGRDPKAVLSAGLGRDKKPVPSMVSKIHKATNGRPINKIAP